MVGVERELERTMFASFYLIHDLIQKDAQLGSSFVVVC